MDKVILVLICCVFLFSQVAHCEEATRFCTYKGNFYSVKYIYDSSGPYFVPATFPAGEPHYPAKVIVYDLSHNGEVEIWCGEGIYVKNGCFEDVPENYVKKALKEEDK